MTKGEIYISLDKKWLEENKAKAAKEYRERFTGEDDPTHGLLFELETDDVEVSGTEIEWTLKSPEDDGPFVTVKYSMDSDDLIRLAEVLIKRLNRAKAAVEAAFD